MSNRTQLHHRPKRRQAHRFFRDPDSPDTGKLTWAPVPAGIEDFKGVFKERIRMIVRDGHLEIIAQSSRICAVRVTSRTTGFTGEGAPNP